MSLLNSCAWNVYRTANSAVRWSGLRKSTAGQKLIAGVNRFGTSALQAILRARSRPFLIRGHRMYLANAWSPSLAFTMSMLLNRYEPGTTLLMERLVTPGMTVVDVGAHAGYFTLLAARLVGPHGKVYAFEPDPSNFALLEKNTALNSYRNVVGFQKAVAESSGQATLFLDARGNDRNSIFREPGSHGPAPRSVTVETNSLDEFLESYGVERVDFLKMDVEGAECAALRGMRRSLAAGKIATMVFEFSPLACDASGPTAEGFLQSIVNAGFGLYRIGSAGELIGVSADSLETVASAARAAGSCNLLAKYREVPKPLCVQGRPQQQT